MTDKHDHRARKRFGQNFLHDHNVIQRIVHQIQPREGQHLVEIGPGKGALTQEVLTYIKHMDVVELDRDLIPILQAELGSQLTIHNLDAMKFDFCSLVEGETKLRVIGNLPYNISTPLIFHLLSLRHCIEDMHFMLQKEVVERMQAGPGSKTFGRLSIMVQYFCRVEKLFIVPPGAFTPAPKVDSAIVRLVPHEQPPYEVDSVETLSKLVAQAFSQRRKTLRNSLKGWLDEAAMIAVGVDPKLRPEQLSLQDFVALCNQYCRLPAENS
ncbi:MAG: 16S rRNA (adenine(1518)-N(6)/adenine(1519)-N(6))-dimethyltransferase RsmA [Gammaproteobacteria bacterium]|nr:16S rRNA (adenine(1518)-N(6)/adenine(1519)-N(6))-dimethyltransferase RsmA [Gammaproteobacteria bacterium]